MRILIVLPCCIGDVVIGTAVLAALRRAYPAAWIAWAVSGWSRAVIEQHPALNAVIDTGAAPLPVKTPGGFVRFVRQMRAGKFDLIVSLVRSPLMSAAVQLAGVRGRAGLDSNGRGFGYNVRAPVDPDQPRHEGEIYLDVVRALGVDADGCYAHVPVMPADRAAFWQIAKRAAPELRAGEYLVVNPAGGRNPGMVMDSKRYPPASLAALANRLAGRYQRRIVLVGAGSDRPILEAAAAHLDQPPVMFAGELTFGQIAALAAESFAYVGNDTGLTHLAGAAGARTIMILGPTDPARYAPFTPPGRSLALWKPAAVDVRGVGGGQPTPWDWSRDGIGIESAFERITAFLDGAYQRGNT
ncbi:MAG: glycosyltransferase family 9 protein [bacterium]|nr:glycosyltransferase family 9 protein [bacterium]